MNDKGIKLSEGYFGKYFSKLYFEKVYFSINKYVDVKDLYILNKDIKENYDKQMKIAGDE